MSSYSETNSVYESDHASVNPDYNDLTADEKAQADPIKKLYEKDKHVINRQIPRNPDASYKTKKTSYYIKKVVVYSTRITPRASIRDPIYGTFLPDKVGSKDEYKYFKVRMSNIATDDRTPITLFYDSPEGYEKHQHMRVSANIKNAWHDRRLAYSGVNVPRFDSPQFIDVR
jgi:hypothetical protein